jgi:hypothetical protein
MTKEPITIRFWKKSHAAQVSLARLVSFGHLSEAYPVMNGILLPKIE